MPDTNRTLGPSWTLNSYDLWDCRYSDEEAGGVAGKVTRFISDSWWWALNWELWPVYIWLPSPHRGTH